jgi:hypothetical protein
MALTPRDKRVLMIGGGVVGAALLLFLVFNVLGGNGGEETAAPPAPAPGELPTVAPSPTESPSEVVNFSGRDPFSAPPALASAATSAAPVDAAAGDAAAGDAGTGDTTSTIAPPADTGTFSPAPTGTGTGTPSGTHTPKPEPTCKNTRKTECRDVGNHTVEILKVYTKHHKLFADVKVDEKKEYKGLKQGDRFAHNFKLVGFNDQKCPRFIFGEEAFTLCEQRKRR